MKYTAEQKKDRLRILEIIHEAKASHIGSCLSVVDIIAAIYKAKRPDERMILSAGHSAVALYAVLEREGILKNPSLSRLNVHPDRDPENGIDVSTGSLGQGFSIAVGIALSNRSKNVWCVTTDGELAEGSMWEALRIASDQKLTNLRLFVNANKWGAYGPIDTNVLKNRLLVFGWGVIDVDGHNPDRLDEAIAESPLTIPILVLARTTVEQFPFLKGQDAHYYTMKPEDFESARLELTK